MTSSPQRFDEAALLGGMASAGRAVDDEELSEALKERGLGTPATRAAIIERLVDVGYVERSGRKLSSTEKARRLIEAVGQHALTSAELTGHWEFRLQQMERLGGQGLEEHRARFAADSHPSDR